MAETNAALSGLAEYLQIRGIGAELSSKKGNLEVPLVIRTSTREIWVDVHHPLVDPARSPSRVATTAQNEFKELIQLDAFSLVHDLPSAVARIQLAES